MDSILCARNSTGSTKWWNGINKDGEWLEIVHETYLRRIYKEPLSAAQEYGISEYIQCDICWRYKGEREDIGMLQ